MRGSIIVAALAVLGSGCQQGSDEQAAPARRGEPTPAAPATVATRPDKNRGALAAVPIPGRYEAAPWLEGAQRIIAVRVAGAPRIAASGLGWIRLHEPDGTVVAEAAAIGVPQALAVADVDGDGAADLIVGRGRGRDALDAPVALQIVRSADLSKPPEVVPLPETSRAEIIDIVPVPGSPGHLWVGLFVSKYMVDLLEAVRGEDGTWSTRPLGTVRVAADLAAGDLDGDGAPELVVARPYGDSLEADGEVFILADGERSVVPSRRGARAVLAVPRPGGPAELVFADGWHREYGARAQALVSRASRAGEGWRTRILAHVRDHHGYTRLILADTDGDGEPEIVAAGHGPAVLVELRATPERAAWAIGSAAAHDVTALDLDGDGADEIIVTGAEPGIWRRAKSR